MIEVKFYEDVADEFLKFAVIISKTKNKWIFCKHKERDTYEVPGGRRELGENITEFSGKLRGKEKFIRVQCTDAQGKKAYTNPIYIK